MGVDYVLLYVGLLAYLVLVLLIVSIPQPVFEAGRLLSGLASVYCRPNSRVRFRVLLPSGVGVRFTDSRIEFVGTTVGLGSVRDFMKLELVTDYSPSRVDLSIQFEGTVEIWGYGVYEVEYECLSMDRVRVRCYKV